MVYFIHSRQSNLAVQAELSLKRIIPHLYLMIWLFALAELLANSTAQAQPTGSDTTEQPSEIAPIDLNLRIVWGGTKSISYVTTIELESGNLSGIQQLGIDANDPSFILKDSNGRLFIDDRETRFGGCDIRVHAKSSSRLKLQIQISDPETAQAITKDYSWSLKSLRDNPELLELGFNDSRLSIDRVPGDRLRVITSRSHLVFNSDEPLNIQIQPYALPWVSTTGIIECTLVRLDDEHQVFRRSKQMALDGRGSGEPYDVLSAAPKEEGVYELRFKIEPKRVLPGIIIRHPSMERIVQFVVYNNALANWPPNGKSPPKDDAISHWHPLIQIPLKSFESQSLTSLLISQIDGSRRFPFFEMARSFSIMTKEPHEPIPEADETNVAIASGAIATTTVNSLVPGQLHRLTVSTSNRNATYRVSLSPTGPRDQKLPVEAMVNDSYDESSIGTIEHAFHRMAEVHEGAFEILFWPNSRSAKLEITNLNASKPLRIASTHIDVWREPLEVQNARPRVAQPSVANVLELHSASVRNLFGSEFSVKQGAASPNYDDWRLFLRFANQVGSYCKANGYDALAMMVHTDGGTLFPSSKWSSNARFDTGTFSTNGRDPIRKDIVELLYRALSRSGIEFVPMLELNSPFREVEELRLKMESSDLLQHREGATITAHSNHLYNPLSSRVQQSIATALEEFEGRYGSHPNYRGFALRASTPSHLNVSVPIEQTNMAILDKFVNAMGGGLPKETTQRQQIISQRFHSAYAHWLKESVAEFLANLKTRPRWVSVENEQAAVQFGSSLFVVSPIQLEAQSQDPSRLLAMIQDQWSMGSPKPIRVAMDKPVHRFDSSLVCLAKLAKPFQAENVRSLSYRDNARTASRTRIWTTRATGNSLLVSNSGAVAEYLHLVWNRMPSDYQLFSTRGVDSSTSPKRVERNDAALEWLVRVSAGEVMRIDIPDDTDSPVSWYVEETATLRTLDSALQSLEQAVSRLSIPQPRAATLTNSSFELHNASIRHGRLSGWTTSIAPNTSVDVDSRASTDGKSSVNIECKSSSSIAWIQSDPFALTPSDRLFVSFQCAAEQIPQQLNLSLTKFDPKSDRFETVAVLDLADRIQQPKEQVNWGNIGLDLSSEFQKASQGNDATLFRLQFEVKGQGRLWLDDVLLSTTFLRDSERRDLRSELFLARTSLQHGDSGPAVAMLISPRGRLIQWGDSTANDRKLALPVRVSQSDADEVQPRSSENRTKSASRVDTKAIDTKQRPVKTLRNYWWQRKQ